MRKSTFAIFFLTIFTSTILAPTVILIVDDSIDVGMFYNITEEEEKKESEQKGKKELIASDFINPNIKFSISLSNLEDVHSLNDYTKPYLNIISPPPEV